MNRALRFVAVLLSFAFFYGVFPASAAQSLAVRSEVVTQAQVNALSSKPNAVSGVDMQALRQELYDAFFKYDAKIDVSKYKIPATSENQNALGLYIYDEMPLAFYVDYVVLWRANGIITNVEPRYVYDKETSLTMLEQYKHEAEHFIADLRGNTQVSDIEKALLLHDRIAVECEFDLGTDDDGVAQESFNGYGVFANGKAVCHGYSEAYDYLLELLGIESTLNRSTELNHTWNVVTINGKKYHVDITWDDPVWGATAWDVVGRIEHRYFMASSEKLYQSHPASDYDTSPVDTTYDDYYWNDSQAAFQLVNNKLYYIDHNAATLNCKTDGTVIRSVKDIWYASSDSYWPKNYSYLGSDGKKLFFSQADAIIEYDPASDVMTTAHIPELEEGTYTYIYGFTYARGYFVYDLNTSPNFGVLTMRRVVVQYDKQVPSVTVSVSNDCAAQQTIEITLEDNIGIKGYYFGTEQYPKNNPFISTHEGVVTQSVSEADTYYIAALDECGNVSEAVGITFYETTLVDGDNSVEPAVVLTESGKTVNLPTPVSDDKFFVGWFTEEQGGVNATVSVVTANQTLYAHWQSEELFGDVNGDTLIDNVDAVVILRYDCGVIEETEKLLRLGDVNSDGEVNNVDAAMILKYDAGLIENF